MWGIVFVLTFPVIIAELSWFLAPFINTTADREGLLMFRLGGFSLVLLGVIQIGYGVRMGYSVWRVGIVSCAFGATFMLLPAEARKPSTVHVPVEG